MKRAVDQAREATIAAHAATVGKKSPSQSFIEKLKETRQTAKSGVAAPNSTSTSTTTPNEEKSEAVRTKLEEHDREEQLKTSSYTIHRSSSSSSSSSSSAVPTYDAFLKSNPTPSSTSTSSSSQYQNSSSGPAYRILKASQLEEKHRKEAEAAADDPMLQRLMMSMPMVSQSLVNPEKNQQLADDIQNFNEKQMEEARKTRSWKSKTK